MRPKNDNNSSNTVWLVLGGLAAFVLAIGAYIMVTLNTADGFETRGTTAIEMVDVEYSSCFQNIKGQGGAVQSYYDQHQEQLETAIKRYDGGELMVWAQEQNLAIPANVLKPLQQSIEACYAGIASLQGVQLSVAQSYDYFLRKRPSGNIARAWGYPKYITPAEIREVLKTDEAKEARRTHTLGEADLGLGE